MTTPAETVWEPLIVTEDDQVPDEPISDPAGAMTRGTWGPRNVTEDDQILSEEPFSAPTTAITAGGITQTVPTTSGHLGGPDPSGVAGPHVDSGADASSSPVATAPTAEPVPGSTSATGGDGARLDARWHEILATFVDDPRCAVELAAGLTDDRAEALVSAVRERQQSLLSTWQGNGAGTEQLRIALQQYRMFGGRLEDLAMGTDHPMPVITPN